MYKRYALGRSESETGGPAGVLAFFVLCAAVVWLVPPVLESVAGHSAELFMVPPVWRGEIMCSPPGVTDRDHTYVYDGACMVRCDIPGCPQEGQTVPVNGRQDVEANLQAARSGLDMHGLYAVVFTLLRYGTVVAALAGLAVMGMRPAWAWLCVPCCVMAAAAAHEQALLALALPAWAAAYCTDVWSTARFGESGIVRHEANPLLRYMVRRCGMRAFVVHAILYGALLGGAAVLLGAAGPLPWGQTLGMLAFGLAGGHAWAAAGNMRVFREGAA